jgi:DNA-binding CsgD family transcriptional regulator/PAS domain-containing protein
MADAATVGLAHPADFPVTDELVTLIYRGPLEPLPWRGFLSALVDHLGCDNAALTLQLSRQGIPPLIVWGRKPPVAGEAARDITQRHAAMGHLDPLRNALQRSGDMALLEEVMPRTVLEQSEFYRVVMKPYGIEQALGMYVSEPGGLECNLGLVSRADGVRLGEAHKRFMQAIKPHFQQALTLFSRSYRDRSELDVLTETLDRLTIATFMIDERRRVIRSNGAAARLLETGGSFRLSDGRLSLAGRTDAVTLRETIDQAIAWRTPGGDGGFVRAFRCHDSGDEGLGVLVRAIPRDRLAPADIGPAVVVYATDAGRTGSFERLVATLFDLSPSEAKLAALLTQGMTLAEAAAETGLTESTVRSYSKRIFSKVGVSRQADLIRLILRSVAMLG